jgi:hypothetical protein
MNQLMKSCFVILALTAAGLAADATPAVGEKSVYALDLEKGSQTAKGHMTLELTAYDSTTDLWTLVNTIEINDRKEVKTTPTKSADLINDAMIDRLLGNCEGSGGRTEAVVSPMGTIPACAMPLNSGGSTGTVWISKVPFGYSKFVTQESDGMKVTGVIESYLPLPPPPPPKKEF